VVLWCSDKAQARVYRTTLADVGEYQSGSPFSHAVLKRCVERLRTHTFKLHHRVLFKTGYRFTLMNSALSEPP